MHRAQCSDSVRQVLSEARGIVLDSCCRRCGGGAAGESAFCACAWQRCACRRTGAGALLSSISCRQGLPCLPESSRGHAGDTVRHQGVLRGHLHGCAGALGSPGDAAARPGLARTLRACAAAGCCHANSGAALLRLIRTAWKHGDMQYGRSHAACTCMQAHWRAFTARRRVRHAQRCIVLLQALARRRACRSRYLQAHTPAARLTPVSWLPQHTIFQQQPKKGQQGVTYSCL